MEKKEPEDDGLWAQTFLALQFSHVLQLSKSFISFTFHSYTISKQYPKLKVDDVMIT